MIKKIYMFFLPVVLMIFLALKCTEFCIDKNIIDKNIIEEIDIQSKIGKYEIVKLSQFSSSIKYLPLILDGEHKINRIVQVDFTPDKILISDGKECLLLTADGSFIRKIGDTGRGPGEYNIISNISFGSNSTIFIQSANGIFLEFSDEGTLINISKVPSNYSPDYYLGSWIQVNDSLFFGQTPITTGKESTKAILFNKNGKIIKEYKNYIMLDRQIRMFTTDDSEASYYSYNGRIYYKEKLNDTLFYLDDNFDLLPRMTFRLGKYLMPKKYRENISFGQSLSPKFNYIFIENVYETQHYLLLDCEFNRYFPAKRITPKIIHGVEIWQNTLNVLGFYNKQNRTLVFIEPTSTDNPLYTSGLYNDIDAGPRFFPMKQVDDSTMVMWVDSKQLKDHIASEEFKNAKPLYPEKKEELKHLANSLKETDNPVLMIVRLKE